MFIFGTFTRNEYYEMQFDPSTLEYHYFDYMPPGKHRYKIALFKQGKPENQRILLDTTLKVKPRDRELKPWKQPYVL